MDEPIQIGIVLGGKYRVEGVIGSGGMGVVARAMQVDLDRAVAIKMLLPEYREQKEAVERFYREAKAAARIRGEHVTQIIDVAKTAEGDPYIVMELLEGEDLSALLKREGKLPLELAVTFMMHACSAVSDAHAARIVHRDLKPSNLFLASMQNGSPVLKVLDFGISRIDDGASQLTLTTSALGTAYYMSPEQIERPKAIDARSDIWALGCILYELLAGMTAFEGDTLPQVVSSVLHNKRKKASDVVPGLPIAIDQILDRCLQSAPAARYQKVAELAEELALVTRIPEHDVIARRLTARAASIPEIVEPRSLQPSPPQAGFLSLPISQAPAPASVTTDAPRLDASTSVLSLSQLGGVLVEDAAPAFRATEMQSSASMPAAKPAPEEQKIELDIRPRPAGPLAIPKPSVPVSKPPPPVPSKPPLPRTEKEKERDAEQPPPSVSPESRPDAPEGDPGGPQRRVVRIIDFDEGKAPATTPKIDLAREPRKPPKIVEVARTPWFKRIATGVGVLVALFLFVIFAGPRIAVSRVRGAAEAAGITVTHDPPSLSLQGWEFPNVHATFAGLPGTTLHAGFARSSWGGGEVTLSDVEVSSQSPWDDVMSTLRSSQSVLPDGLEVLELHFVYSPRPDLTFEGQGASFGAHTAPGGRTVQFLSPRAFVKAKGMTLGPYGLNLEKTQDTSRARIALDPAIPEGPSIIIVDHNGLLHVGAQAGRATLARYGVPAAFLGLAPGDSPEGELTIDAQVNDKGVILGTFMLGLYGMKVGASAPLDVVGSFEIEGSTKEAHVKSTDAKIGPFPAFIRGDWRAPEPSRFVFHFQTTPVSCAEIVRAKAAKQLGVAGVLVSDVVKFAGALVGNGTVSTSGTATLNLGLPPDAQVDFTSKDTCGLGVFRK